MVQPYQMLLLLQDQLFSIHSSEYRRSACCIHVLAGRPLAGFRLLWHSLQGPFLAAGGYNKHSGDVAIEDGTADLITYGRFWLSTPDLPQRFAKGAPINHYDRDTFYSTDPVKGYSDYPFLDEIPKDTPTYMHYSGMEMFK